MPKQGLHAHVILDRSGSMESCRESTVSAFNEYVTSLRNEKGIKPRISLTQFDTDGIDRLRKREKVKQTRELTVDEYQPRSMTPLLDAVGRTVMTMRSEAKEGERQAVVILTDGLENASREWTRDRLRALLDEVQEKLGWLVIFLGADQDAFAEGATFGTVAMNTASYSTRNMAQTMAAAGRATMSYARSGVRADAAFTADERKQMTK